MLNHLASLPTYTQIAVWIILSLILTTVLMVVMHKIIQFDLRQKHNDVIGFLIAVVGVLHALIMASVLVIAKARLQELSQLPLADLKIHDLLERAVLSAEFESPESAKALLEHLLRQPGGPFPKATYHYGCILLAAGTESGLDHLA
jgi:signal transduction histidine kinase